LLSLTTSAAAAAAAAATTSIRTWLISGSVANLGECRQATKSQQDGQAEKDDRIQANPNSVHDDVLLCI
jgi:hypothetical protein